MPLSQHLRVIDYQSLPCWSDDRLGEAFSAFRRSAMRALETPYKSGALGVEAGAFESSFREARILENPDDATARDFFERHFAPCLIYLHEGEQGFVTGFYEPQVEASPVKTAKFSVPLLARPADLVKVDDCNRPEGFDPYLAFARQSDDGLVEYHDRRAIEQGALKGIAEPLAWVADKVDAFFIHVQGATRLVMPDGSVTRLIYAAKSGQRFTGPGRILIELGEIPAEKVSMQAIRAWFRDHPDRVDEILQQNRSYIFFRKADVTDTTLGPVAAAKVPLTAGRSLAVDRLLHTFGTPFFINAPTLTAFGGVPFSRLMIAQDTGSAIVGPARGDLFAGSGDAAGEIAGVVRHPADFYALVPHSLVTGA